MDLHPRHRTTDWEYYIGNTRVGVVSGNNAQPPSTVSHTIDWIIHGDQPVPG